MMLYIILLGSLLTVSADSVNIFHNVKSTEYPSSIEDSSILKPRKSPTHISEFTDPHTGLNPFLDLEEGLTAAGRNVMEDERKIDASIYDFELVEGDSNFRKWDSRIVQEPSEEPGHHWPLEKHVLKVSPTTSTAQYTVETITEDPTSRYIELNYEESKEKRIKTFSGPWKISNDSIMYAAATVTGMLTLILLVTLCCWRRRVKRTAVMATDEENRKK